MTAPPSRLNVPGSSLHAYAMLPLRAVLAGMLFAVAYPILLALAVARAVYLRAVVGSPSTILQKGTYGNDHKSDFNHVYPSHVLLSAPINPAKMRPILETLAAEGGIAWSEVELKVMPEAPNDWPATGSWRSDHFVPQLKGIDHFTYWQKRSGCVGKVIRVHVWNGKSKPKQTNNPPLATDNPRENTGGVLRLPSERGMSTPASRGVGAPHPCSVLSGRHPAAFYLC